MTAMTLFDPDEFGPGTDRRRTSGDASPPPVEPYVKGWELVRHGRSLLPFFHLVKGHNEQGSVVTVCGRWGTLVGSVGTTQMVCCPTCLGEPAAS